MMELAEKTIHCPYCAESLQVLLDPQEAGQQYIEDCQVCCKPIVFLPRFDESGALSIAVFDENEAI